MKNKKAQEEMVGFVLIIVVVAVIFLIFLGIFASRGGTQERSDSEEIFQFLDAALEYHVEECSPSNAYNSLKDITLECHKSSLTSCSNGKDVCTVVEETFKKIIETGWKFSQASPESGYALEIRNPDETLLLPAQTGGVSTNRLRAAEKLLSVPDGALSIKLEIFLKQSS